jgi:hypothetical protein
LPVCRVFRALVVLFRGAFAPSRGLAQRTFVPGGFRRREQKKICVKKSPACAGL